MELQPLQEQPEDIVNVIIEKLRAKFGETLLYVGGKGSLANGGFTPFSDLDLVVVLNDDSAERYETFIYNTTPLSKVFKDMERQKYHRPMKYI